MALAYLILAHREAPQVELLFRTIYHPEDTFVLHFDRRAPAALRALGRRLAATHANVRLLPARSIVWGGFSMPAVQLAAMRVALGADARWHHFVNLTGQDFPLRNRDAILAALAADPHASYLSWFDPLSTGIWRNARERIGRYHLDWYWLHRLLQIPGLGRRLRALLGWRGTMPHIPGYNRPASGLFHYYGGANHVALSRRAVAYLTGDRAARRIIDWLRAAAHPDEIVFQSVLLNSPLRPDLVNDDLRYVEFEHPTDPHPKILTSRDLPRLEASGRLWARKFDINHDTAVLKTLAAALAP